MSDNRPTRPPVRQKLSVFGTPWPLEPALLRVRLKYVSTRFLQMPEPRMSLRNTAEMLRWAQQMIDDGMPRPAHELLRLAIEEDPEQRGLWLFLIDCLARADDEIALAEVTEAFARQFPNDPAQAEVDRLRQSAAARTIAGAPGTSASPVMSGRHQTAQYALHVALLSAQAR